MKLQIISVFVLINAYFINASMDMDELKSVLYGFEISPEPIVLNENQEAPEGALDVVSKHGQKYQCSFPDRASEEKKKEEEEKIAIETGIVEMLKPMGIGECIFKTKDWWSYEFCFGKYIRQFHLEDGAIKGDMIYLGFFKDDFDWNNETAKEARMSSMASTGLPRYHSQYYTNGDKCDLTGQPRQAEVRFVCEEGGQDQLLRIDESETCVYTVTITTGRICRHPYLKIPARRRAVPITCSPVLSQPDYQLYMQEKEEQRKKDELQRTVALKKLSEQRASGAESGVEATLTQTMSRMAKNLLSKPLDHLIDEENLPAVLTKEQFEVQFGKQWSYDLYLKAYEVIKQKKEKMEMIKKRDAQKEEAKVDKNLQEQMKIQNDEDEAVISEFDKEIADIRSKFMSSAGEGHDPAAEISQKMAIKNQWEENLEDVIKEAEAELGVKMDRSLISGLTNTLDKLVNRLQDTRGEMKSMEKELKSIVADHDKKATDNKDIAADDDEEEEDEEDEEEDVAREDKKKTDDRSLAFKSEEKLQENNVPDNAEDSSQNSFNQRTRGIQPPPDFFDNVDPNHPADFDAMNDPGYSSDPPPGLPGTQPEADLYAEPEGPPADPLTDPPIKPTQPIQQSNAFQQSPAEDEEEEEALPASIKKMIEDSVKREHLKNIDKPLSFDADNSFHKDKKTIHIIQDDDETGKKNRLIVVVGFDSFNDESAETQRQAQLESSYNFQFSSKEKEQKTPNS